MIALYILLTVLAVSEIFKFFAKKNRDIYCFIQVVSIVLLLLWGLVAGTHVSERGEATRDYNQLALYQEAVENSDSEALRFDYYEQVRDWNRYYDYSKRIAENPWLNWFLLRNMDFETVNRINFELKE